VANANAMVYRNGTAVAYGGASPDDLTLSLGALSNSALGDQVTTLQYIGGLESGSLIAETGSAPPPVCFLVGNPESADCTAVISWRIRSRARSDDGERSIRVGT
jgi:hypothetical protein